MSCICVEALGPFLPLLAISFFDRRIARRDARILAPIALVGGALASDLILFLKGDITASFRYFILAFPFGYLPCRQFGCSHQDARSSSGQCNRIRHAPARMGRWSRAPLRQSPLSWPSWCPPPSLRGLPCSTRKLVHTRNSRSVGSLCASKRNRILKTRTITLGSCPSEIGSPVATFLDGDVLSDAASCMSNIITTIAQPKLFVIPNDRDFQWILADPISFHTHYILQSDPTGNAGNDTSIEYPTLWSTERLDQTGAYIPKTCGLSGLSSFSRSPSFQRVVSCGLGQSKASRSESSIYDVTCDGAPIR